MESSAEQITDILERLEHSGWSIGNYTVASRGAGLVWVVSGRNGNKTIWVEANNELEAWKRAEKEALALDCG